MPYYTCFVSFNFHPMHPQPGQPAPDFSLPDQNGTTHTLSQYRGKWVLLYFYPKDDTAGCTQQACGLRDQWSEFQQRGIVVLGVSKDSVKSHDKFARKYQLPFPVLADEEKAVQGLYDVWQKKKFMGREYMGTVRTSFLIDPEGKIVQVYEKVKTGTHSAMVLEELKNML